MKVFFVFFVIALCGVVLFLLNLNKVQTYEVVTDSTENAFEHVLKTTTTTTKPTLGNNDKIKVAVCTASKSRGHWNNVEMTTLVTLLIPSIKRTITEKEKKNYNITLYIAVDDNDPFWLQHHPSLYSLLKDELHLSIKIVVVENVPNRVPFNDVTQKAFEDGADYIARVNDDTEFVTSGWITIGMQALSEYKPPNVGVVGPLCREGNTAILTHDMVHRTHMVIFKNYYPPVFQNWWIDDWITHVYEPDRSRVLKNWVVKHHIGKHGTRYKVKHSAAKELGSEINRGKELIKGWIKHDVLSQQKMDWTVVVSVSEGFFQMFLNWWYYYKKHYLNLQVYVFAEDEFVFSKLKYALEIKVFKSSQKIERNFAETYGSSGYKEMVSKRAGYILKSFESCNRVIYTDVDTIWKYNPLPHLVGNYDLWASLDDISYVCTGFFAIIKTQKTVSFLKKWNNELINQSQLNQPVFNRVLKSTNIKTAYLNRNEFPSGNIYFSKSSPKNAVIIHNNFIIGLDKKVERFKHWGLWNPVHYDFSCVQFKQMVHRVGDINYNLPQKLCSPVVENATMTDNGFVYNKSIQLDAGKWYWKKKQALEVSSPERMLTYSETFFSFVQIWQDVFQHIVFDTLPKFAAICKLLLNMESYKIIVVGLLQQELMQAVCPITNERFVLKKKLMLGNNLIRPIFWSGDFKMGVTPQDVLNPLGGHVPGSKIIYLPRPKSMKRRVENEKDVLELLKHRYGKFLQVYIPKDNWKDDREVFKHAKVIVGPHGGAMSNMVFAPSGTKIIEFIPLDELAQNDGNDRPCYMGLANALGFNYTYVNTLKFSFEGPMQVDLDDLKKKLGSNGYEVASDQNKHMKRTENENSKTTIVMMGYSSKRFSNYKNILRSYGSMKTVLDKIILIWCNQNSPPPTAPRESSVPVVILSAATNSLNNRYEVADMVRTSTVVSVDDDVKLSEALIEVLIKTHSQQPNRIIGVDGRSYDLNGKYNYHTNPGTTMALTKTWIISKRFFAPYMKDKVLLDFINSKDVHNCEDIAMNFVVQNLTGNDALIVTMDEKNYRETLPEPDGLSISTSADKWNDKRSKCVMWMLNHFQMRFQHKVIEYLK
jgi:hypothetical protein